MCWRDQWADRGCLSGTRARKVLGNNTNGTIDAGTVSLLHSACFGEYERTGLVDDAHGTKEAGKVPLLHGACVGEVDGLTEGAFWAQGLAHGLQMIHTAQ